MDSQNEKSPEEQPTGDEPEELGGESAGELDLEPTQQFFVSKKAAAVLKHGILRRYVTPWASKVGSTADNGRVVYLDGYAGPGRYEDGTDGSPALVLRTAQSLSYRNLECHFVEKKRKDYQRLAQIVEQARAAGITAEAYPGRLETRLAQLIEIIGKAPLFAFLDPFGLAISFDDITGKVMGGARDLASGRKTEVLLNFSANAVRRIGAFLDPSCSARNRDATLDSMDEACGGSWWRDEFAAHDTNEARVEAIARGFMQRVAARTNSGGWTLPVRNRASLQPVYHLVFFSRHQDGLWLFLEALAGAQKDWRRELAPPPPIDEGALFQLEDTFDDEESRRRGMWVDEIKANITHMLRKYGTFTMADRYIEVFGSTLGLATPPMVREAVKALYIDGITGCNGIGDVIRFVITSAQMKQYP